MSEEANTKPVMTSISNALGMAPLVLDEEPSLPGVLPAIPEIDEEEPELPKADKEAEEDFAVSRANMKGILEKGEEALDGILRIASGSEHPRAYEVAANLIKTMADVNQSLLKLHEQRRQLVPVPEPEKTTNNTQISANNVFVGTTAQLLEQWEELERAQEAAAKGNVIEHDS